MYNINLYQKRKEKAMSLFAANRSSFCPYFKQKVVFNADGFHHLQFSARRERNKEEQTLKFNLLPLAIQIIRKSGTVQEYRKTLGPTGKKSKTDGMRRTKEIEYWGFVAIIMEYKIKIRVILRRVGGGNITFWSVMPHSKLKRNQQQKLFMDDIHDA